MRRSAVSLTCLSLLAALAFVAPAANGSDHDQTAREILKDARWTRGICVSLDAGGAELAVALAKHSELSVYRIEADDEAVRRTRQLAETHALSPLRIRVERGPLEDLAYPPWCANLILADTWNAELARLLRPAGGKAYLRAGGAPTEQGLRSGQAAGLARIERLPLEGAGEWTHFQYDPTNNTYSPDRLIRPPFGVLWYHGPGTHRGGLWFGQGLAAGGLLFTTDLSPHNPQRCVITARDAYNGLVHWAREVGGDRFLWQEPVNKEISWISHINAPGKIQPHQMAIADGKLYVADSRRCLVLEASSGKDLAALETPAPSSSGNIWGFLALSGGTLFGYTTAPHKVPGAGWRYRGTPPERSDGGGPAALFALDPASGSPKWVRGGKPGDELGESFEAPLAIGAGCVFVRSADTLYALDAQSGATRWAKRDLDGERKTWWEAAVHQDKLYVLRYGSRFYNRTLAAGRLVLDVRDGRKLAEEPHGKSDEKGPSGIAEGLMCLPATPRGCGIDTAAGHVVFGRNGYRVYDPARKSWGSGEYFGARAACQVGAIPAGGVVHLLPNWGCTCRPFHAAATLYPTTDPGPAETAPASNPEKRGAWPARAPAREDDWPTFRLNAARTAVTSQDLSRPMTKAWETQTGGEPTSPVAVGDLVFFGSSDETVRAVDASSGKERWRFYATGPIRAAPVYGDGGLFFGSEDGWVYALAAQDGTLLWRIRVAPGERRQAGFGRIVSYWPVQQGLAVAEGKVFFAAGRVPGQGVFCGALDATDGRVLWRAFGLRGVPSGHAVAGGDRVFFPLESNRGDLMHFSPGDGKALEPCAIGLTTAMSFNAGHEGDGAEFAKGFLVHGGGGVDRFGGQSKRNAYSISSPWNTKQRGKLEEFGNVRSFFPVVGRSRLYFGHEGVLSALERPKMRALLDPKASKGGALFQWQAPDLPCGKPEWAILAGEDDTAKQATLLAGGPKGLTAVEAASGKVRWSLELDGATFSPAVARGRVFLTFPDGKICCLSASK